MTDTKTTKQPRRMAREPKANDQLTSSQSKAPTRLDQLQQLLTQNGGTNIAEMSQTTGWQQHSVRGAMAGALKKRGLVITSQKVDGIRCYRAGMPE